VTATGLDYSGGQILPASAITTAGHSFVIRYVDDPALGLSGKHINQAEYAVLRAAGVTVWLVFEKDTTDITGGGPEGVAHAERAVAGARWLGYPAGQPIFFACDEHIAAAQIATGMAYLDGAASVLAGTWLLGAYGFPEFIQAAQAGGHAQVFWQCGHDPGTGAGVHLWQRNDLATAPVIGGVPCDIDMMYLPPPTLPVLPLPGVPAASTTSSGDNVILLDWTAPQGAHKLVVPVGSASAVTAAAWLSLACDGVLGHYDIWFQSDRGGLSDFHGSLAKDQRQWWTVPDGCTQITVHYSGATGAVGAAIETKPK
jgi:hypothetical protein